MTRFAWGFAAYASFIITASVFGWLLSCDPKHTNLMLWIGVVAHVVVAGAASTAWCAQKALRTPPR